MTIRSAMRLNITDLDAIGQSKARTYKTGGAFVAVVENDKFAVVQGYKIGNTISECDLTCIRVRDLAGLAKACYGDLQDL